MSFAITMTGLSGAISKINAAAEKKKKAVVQAKNTTAINVQRKAKKNVTSHGSRMKGGKNTAYLVETGAMRASIAISFDRNFSDLPDESNPEAGTASTAIASAGREATGVGTNVSYAKFHEFGAPGANIPKRSFLTPAAESERADHRARMIKALQS